MPASHGTQSRSGDRRAHDWVVVLAGGQGRRMRHLTIDAHGQCVPKQFCSLGHGPSLLFETLWRARAVVPAERILVSVTESHQRWWRGLHDCLPPENVLVQPEQRGTGIAILQPLLEILRRDPHASLAILPADHYFHDEAVIEVGLAKALRLTHADPQRILLLGFEPEDADPALGYIVPAHARSQQLDRVRRFVEKPGTARVQSLIDKGALWNSFIVVASGAALLKLFERHCPRTVATLRDFVASPREPAERSRAPARLFADIPPVDFCAQVIATDSSALEVLRLPACGWSDLGTPARLERVVHRYGTAIERASYAPPAARGKIDLSALVCAASGSASRASSARS